MIKKILFKGRSSLPLLVGFFALVLPLFFTSNCNKGEVLETIGGKGIYTKEYENFYSTSVEMAGRLAGVERKDIANSVCNPESKLSKALNPPAHYSRFRDTFLVAQAAEAEGFADKPEVKRMLENSRLQALSQYYINTKILAAIEIPEETKVKVCEALRKKEPQKMAALSLDDCLSVAERVLKQRLLEPKSKEVIKDIRESVAVKANEDFDKKKYLKALPLYEELKEEGGCSGSPAKEDKDTEKTKK